MAPSTTKRQPAFSCIARRGKSRGQWASTRWSEPQLPSHRLLINLMDGLGSVELSQASHPPPTRAWPIFDNRLRCLRSSLAHRSTLNVSPARWPPPFHAGNPTSPSPIPPSHTSLRPRLPPPPRATLPTPPPLFVYYDFQIGPSGTHSKFPLPECVRTCMRVWEWGSLTNT